MSSVVTSPHRRIENVRYWRWMMCKIGLHKYKVLKTDHAPDGVSRGLCECENCKKLFHAFSIGGKFGAIGPIGDMMQFWDTPEDERR